MWDQNKCFVNCTDLCQVFVLLAKCFVKAQCGCVVQSLVKQELVLIWCGLDSQVWSELKTETIQSLSITECKNFYIRFHPVL